MAVPFRSLPLFLIALASLSGLSGCGSASEDGATPGYGGAPPDHQDSDIEELAFTGTEPLLLGPGEEVDLEVRLFPPLRRRVDFALVAVDDSASFDGFVTDSSVLASNSGIARTTLIAPTRPAVFSVRASVGELTVHRAVSVSSEGFATVVIRPDYSGRRDFDRWVASARSGTRCEDLHNPWQDGPLVAAGEDLVTLGSIPAGPEVAIVLRQGQAVSGCAVIGALKPNQTTEVTIRAMDRPIQLAGTEVDVNLGIEETTAAFTAHLDAAINQATAALVAEAPDDGELVVQGMKAAIADLADVDAFEANATDHQFATLARNALAEPLAIRKRTRNVLVDAAASIPGPAALQGVLDLTAGDPVFYLESARGVSAAMSGFLGASIWTVDAQPNDVLVLGGTLTFQPGHWLAAIAEQQARAEASTIGDKLLDTARCTSVGDVLADAAGGEVHPGCTMECAIELCRTAVVEAWDRAQNAGLELSSMLVGLTADARVDEGARLLSFDGTWVGTLGNSASVSGPADGASRF